MEKIKVMVIDDSALMRQILSKLINADPDMEVVTSVSNAVYGINLIPRHHPDIITLDIEMPDMDGLTALTEIRKLYPTLPVIMCSSLTLNGAEETLEALNRGADDYVTKPSSQGSRQDSFDLMSRELLYKIRGLVSRKKEHALPVAEVPVPVINNAASVKPTGAIELVAIGISTGGPNALHDLLPQFPANFPAPIVIVQHMPPLFTKILADNLQKKCKLIIKEAEDGELLQPGYVYIAPGNYHMVVTPHSVHHKAIKLNQEAPENSCRPAADVLFRSAARIYKKHLLALVMTGMGHDGMLGCKEVKQWGGYVVVQDKESSVVWGMPGSVANAGYADKMLPLTSLGREVINLVSKKD